MAKKVAPKIGKKIRTKNGLKKVTEISDAMNLEKDIFKSKDPKRIAASVKHSAEKSKRKKAGPFNPL